MAAPGPADPGDPLVRRVEVGISVEALVQQWARQEGGPAGAAVVVATEVAGRRRNGVEWRATDALAVGVLARPVNLEPDRVELGWLAASLAAAVAADRLWGGVHTCRWPDGVELGTDGPTGVDRPEIVAGSTAALGPGRVDHVVLVARIAPVGSVDRRRDIEAALVDGLRSATAALDRPDELLNEYRRRCQTLGRVVSGRLLPTGSARGRAVAIDEGGALVLESDTGFRQRVTVAACRDVD